MVRHRNGNIGNSSGSDSFHLPDDEFRGLVMAAVEAHHAITKEAASSGQQTLTPEQLAARKCFFDHVRAYRRHLMNAGAEGQSLQAER